MRGDWIIACGLVAVAIAAGVATRGPTTVHAQGEATSQEWLRDFPSYPEARPYQLGDMAQVGGHTFQAAYFVTEANLAALVDFYHGVWEGQGRSVHVTAHREQTVVSTIDLSAMRILSVIIAERGAGRVVMPTVTPLQQQATTTGIVELPPMPGSRQVHRTAFEDHGLRSATTIYGVGAEPAKVQHWYRSQMPALGFSLEREDTHNGMDILHYQAGSVAVDVGISEVSTTPPVSMIGVVYLEQP